MPKGTDCGFPRHADHHARLQRAAGRQPGQRRHAQGVVTPGGQTLALAYNLDDRVDEVQRAYDDGDSTTTESFLYEYLTGGDNDGRLGSVTLRRKVDDGDWQDIRRVRYSYYESGASYGSIGDLQTAVHQLPNGASWDDHDTYYYRYYQDDASGIGFQYGLKYALGPAAYRRLAGDPDVSDPLGATDDQVAAYADFYFEFDSQQRVTKETVEAAARTFTFAYTAAGYSSSSGDADDYNHWDVKTVETLPDGTGAISTEYSYTYHSGTVQVATRTTTLPAVPAEQNGQNVAHDVEEVYDEHGNLTWTKGACGSITRHYYDVVTGARTRTIEDVDTDEVDDEPAGWTTVCGWAEHLTTDFEQDDLGRTTQTLGPLHNANGQQVRRASWTVYQDADDETWSASGYAVPETDGDGYDYAIVGPVSISRQSDSDRTADQISAVPSHTVGRLTGDEAFAQSSWCRWTRSILNNQSRLVSSRTYYTIPAEDDGLPGTHYDETTYAYDALGRQNKTTSPGGTITRTVFDARGRAVRTYVGTCDSAATETDPTGDGDPENNMVLVTETHYDHGDGGDGNVTKTVQHVDEDPRNARITQMQYDWRNRLIATDGELDFFQAQEYDNLDRVVKTDQHDTTAAGNLVARSETKYDERGQVYQSIRYAVNVETGEVTGRITSNTWYDASGRAIKEKPGGSERFTRTTYDGLGRAVKVYVGYDVDEAYYEDATDVDGDSIYEQGEITYDDAGNVIETVARQRIHGATGTGELEDPGTEPRARVSYACAWHDGAGRRIASADYGTNGGEILTRPDTVPERSDDVLVNSTDYNARGEAYATIDPMGREDRTVLDDAGRMIETIENYSPLPSTGEGQGVRADQNKTTRMSYTPDGQTATLTAVNPTTGDQTTRYVYGTTRADSFIARSDLLRAEIYPDSDDTAYDDGDDGTYDRIEYTYNRQGEQKSKTDQNGTVHGYTYDKLGRLLHDWVETLAPGVEGRVRRLSQTYGVAGRLLTISSHDHRHPKCGSIVNQVLFQYNDLGLPVAEYQSHSGAVDMVLTPKVQYGYDDTTESGEFIKGLRPISLTYPDGRIVRYEYADASSSSGTGDDPDDLLNRIKFIADDDEGSVGTHLAEYAYLGVGAIVSEDYAEPQVKLDYTQDDYAGFDRFGRIVDQRWHNYGTGVDVDRYGYGHDRAGNRTYRRNMTTTERDEFYTYDGLYRLVRADRGNLDATKTRIAGTAERQEAWSLDATGNWTRYLQREAGAVTLDQQRAHNPVNEVTSIEATVGADWADPAHDRAGNMTSVPKPSSLANELALKYDAWNRLVQVKDGQTVVANYEYDGSGRRIKKGVDTESPDSLDGIDTYEHYFHAGVQVIETRDTGTESAEAGDLQPQYQYVWSPRYIDAPILRDENTDADNLCDDARLYYLSDANFNVTSLVETSGEALERYVYAPYGSVTIYNGAWTNTRSSSSYSNGILFTGRELDVETEVYYYRARYCTPRLGRFLCRDLGLDGSMPVRVVVFPYADGVNAYQYVGANPTTRLDPTGLRWLDARGEPGPLGDERVSMQFCCTFRSGSKCWRQTIEDDWPITVIGKTAFAQEACRKRARGLLWSWEVVKAETGYCPELRRQCLADCKRNYSECVERSALICLTAVTLRYGFRWHESRKGSKFYGTCELAYRLACRADKIACDGRCERPDRH